MLVTILLILAGLVLILAGANYLTEGASDLAKRMRVSDFVVGVTVVAFGTSMPEFIVSFMSALGGKGDMAVGNVLGSNLFNILMILGITALIKPLGFTRGNLKKDIPFAFLSAVALFIVASDTLIDGGTVNYVGRNEGFLLLCFFAIFMVYTIYSTQPVRRFPKQAKPTVAVKRKMWHSLILVGGGLVGLVFGGDLFLDNAVKFAQNLGISESVIAVTLLAGGTSMPELAASVAAALKNKSGMALGNIVGSNIFNVFFVLGASATAAPLTTSGIVPEDMIFLIIVSALLFGTAYTFKKGKLDRAEGVIFIALYIGYIIWMLNR